MYASLGDWPLDTGWDREIVCGRCYTELIPACGDRIHLVSIHEIMKVIETHQPLCSNPPNEDCDEV
jgi:hypothetical protein